MGFGHHSAHIVWLEQARVELMRSWGHSHASMEAEGLFIAVVDLHVRYLRPARYDDVITAYARLERLTAARAIVRNEIYRDETLLSSAEVTLACLDAAGLPQRLPPFFEAALRGAPLEVGGDLPR